MLHDFPNLTFVTFITFVTLTFSIHLHISKKSSTFAAQMSKSKTTVSMQPVPAQPRKSIPMRWR